MATTQPAIKSSNPQFPILPYWRLNCLICSLETLPLIQLAFHYYLPTFLSEYDPTDPMNSPLIYLVGAIPYIALPRSWKSQNIKSTSYVLVWCQLSVLAYLVSSLLLLKYEDPTYFKFSQIGSIFFSYYTLGLGWNLMEKVEPVIFHKHQSSIYYLAPVVVSLIALALNIARQLTGYRYSEFIYQATMINAGLVTVLLFAQLNPFNAGAIARDLDNATDKEEQISDSSKSSISEVLLFLTVSSVAVSMV